jgi:hypothetical protein
MMRKSCVASFCRRMRSDQNRMAMAMAANTSNMTVMPIISGPLLSVGRSCISCMPGIACMSCRGFNMLTCVSDLAMVCTTGRYRDEAQDWKKAEGRDADDRKAAKMGRLRKGTISQRSLWFVRLDATCTREKVAAQITRQHGRVPSEQIDRRWTPPSVSPTAILPPQRHGRWALHPIRATSARRAS